MQLLMFEEVKDCQHVADGSRPPFILSARIPRANLDFKAMCRECFGEWAQQYGHYAKKPSYGIETVSPD